MDIQYLLSGIVGLVILYFIIKLIKLPLKLMFKLIINGVLGLIILQIVNAIGANIGITVSINIFTALIAGFLGIPGVIAIIVFSLFV